MDYDTLVQNVTFNKGDTSRVVYVTINDDTMPENDELFEVFIKTIPDYPDVVIGQPSVATGTILDNDLPSKTIKIVTSKLMISFYVSTHCIHIILYAHTHSLYNYIHN